MVFLWGSNAREAHPIWFHHLLKAVRRGARLYVMDPRRTSSAQWADVWLGLNVGTDIALANAMAREIIHAGLANEAFIRHATTGFDEYRAAVEPYTLEHAERITGVPAAVIRDAALAYARAEKAMICWTLGITEHHNAVDNVLALINLALLPGHGGKYGSGINPLRGQNNVQGGGDMGAIPNRLPGFQDVLEPSVREKFERAWGTTLQPKHGLNLTEMLHAMEHGEMTSLFVVGENPAQSDADARRVGRILEGLEHLRAWCSPPPRAGARRRARSSTASAGCSACARRWSPPTARATSSGSSPRSGAAWATTGVTRRRSRRGTSCGRSRPTSPA